jgi:hypothetical protein
MNPSNDITSFTFSLSVLTLANWMSIGVSELDTESLEGLLFVMVTVELSCPSSLGASKWI